MLPRENELGISPSIMDELICIESAQKADCWRLFERLGYKMIVFNNGHIYDVARLRNGHINRADIKQGYYMRVPYVGTAHRIVAYTYGIIYVYEYDHLHDIDHKNGDRYDNRPSNLRVITHSANIICRDRRGGKNLAVEGYIVENGVEEIIWKCESIKKAAYVTGLKESNICSCCKGRLRHTGGLRWRYSV